MNPPTLSQAQVGDGQRGVLLSGSWTLIALGGNIKGLESQVAAQTDVPHWNLLQVDALDSAGAVLLWRAWGRKLPAQLTARPEHLHLFERLSFVLLQKEVPPPPRSALEWLITLGNISLLFSRHLADMLALIGQIMLDALHCLRQPRDIPWREFSATLYKSGVRAMPVTALLGFMIGVVLSYLSAFQLRNFGADIFIINLLGFSIIRELGPVLVAVLVAGRSGSAMTAQLGVMRVTEEIDALAAMGISRILRLVLPKVAALAVVMPLLGLWTAAIALIGGMISAHAQLDIGYGFFIETLPRVVPVANLWIGIAKGFVFGILVALVACHFGLRVRPNTESLSANTTASVVTSITLVILIDAIFAIAMRNVGLPRL